MRVHPLIALKRYLPRSLLGRSLLIIVMPLILLQVVSTWIFYDRHWETVTKRLAASVAGEISNVIETRRHFKGEENERWIFETAAQSLALGVRFEKGKILPNTRRTTGSGILERRLGDALRERVRRPFHMDTTSQLRQVNIAVQLSDGVLHVTVDEERLFSSTTYIFVMWMVGTSMLLFAIATIFMRNQVRPIRRLARAVDAFGKGRDATGFKPEGSTEIRQAAAAFNVMRNRVLRNISQRTEMLAGVSHDLRTPLTRMKLQLAMLDDTAAINALRDDVLDMEKLVEEYLAFARGESAERVERCNARRLLEDVAARARQPGGGIKITCPDDLEIEVRPNGFGRCLTNLINNAATYGHSVSVEARHASETVEFLIDDDGPGIPEDKREEVFGPFLRLDSARGPDTGGTGLGLTIARDVVLSHGGTIEIDDSPMGGARLLVRLPV